MPPARTRTAWGWAPGCGSASSATCRAREAMSVFLEPVRVRAYRDGARLDLGLKRTDGAFWTILQFDFLEGGPYGVQDVGEARPVAVINESTRRKLFDGAPARGRWLELEGQRFQVIGVVRDASPLRRNPWSDVWVPITTARNGEHLADLSVPCRGHRAGRPAPPTSPACGRRPACAPPATTRPTRRRYGRVRVVDEDRLREDRRRAERGARRPPRPQRPGGQDQQAGGVRPHAQPAVHAAARGEPHQPQRQPDPRAGLRDRGAQGLRGLVAGAGGAVRRRERRADHRGRRPGPAAGDARAPAA